MDMIVSVSDYCYLVTFLLIKVPVNNQFMYNFQQ